MMPLETRPWDPAEHLATPGDVAGYLEAALEDGDPHLIMAVLGDVARAYGLSQLATKTGLTRESLQEALSSDANPDFATVLRILQALGVRLAAVADDLHVT